MRGLALAFLVVGCGADPAPDAPPPMGPCAPVLDTCGDCLAECAQLFDHGHGQYGETSPEGAMGLPEGSAYGLRDHCIDGDCRPVYARRQSQCYGICQPVYEGWVECAVREGRCETVSVPR